MKNKDKNNIRIDELYLEEYNKFPKLYCPTLRRHVFHGIKENDGIQTIVCLSCGKKHEFHIDGRNKIEKSLWDLYSQHKDEIKINPPSKKRPKKRWSPRYLFQRL